MTNSLRPWTTSASNSNPFLLTPRGPLDSFGANYAANREHRAFDSSPICSSQRTPSITRTPC
ncbi:MAG TPA: hypothetical protein VGQ46_13760 [Thermoanaerobaculia bacterium]|nr:hypothetical protein [Thermoanaerobaculia bacterium]